MLWRTIMNNHERERERNQKNGKNAALLAICPVSSARLKIFKKSSLTSVLPNLFSKNCIIQGDPKFVRPRDKFVKILQKIVLILWSSNVVQNLQNDRVVRRIKLHNNSYPREKGFFKIFCIVPVFKNC